MAAHICKQHGCQNRAWQGELCNLHMLQSHRPNKRHMPSTERLAQGKRILRERAKALGIVLDDAKQEVVSAVRAVQSPVA